ncbi:MAG: hypothetical protein Q9191_007838, partial [Dirinaria sp. TL-2023a]
MQSYIDYKHAQVININAKAAIPSFRMAALRSSRDLQFSMAGDRSRANRPIQTLKTPEQGLKRSTTNQIQGDSRETNETWTTVRRKDAASKLGKFDVHDQALGNPVPSKEVQSRKIPDADGDIGDDKRSTRLPRHMFKPGLI